AKISVMATPSDGLAGSIGAMSAERNKTILGLERFVAKPVRKECRSRPNCASCSANDMGTALRDSQPALKVEHPMYNSQLPPSSCTSPSSCGNAVSKAAAPKTVRVFHINTPTWTAVTAARACWRDLVANLVIKMVSGPGLSAPNRLSTTMVAREETLTRSDLRDLHDQTWWQYRWHLACLPSGWLLLRGAHQSRRLLF